MTLTPREMAARDGGYGIYPQNERQNVNPIEPQKFRTVRLTVNRALDNCQACKFFQLRPLQKTRNNYFQPLPNMASHIVHNSRSVNRSPVATLV